MHDVDVYFAGADGAGRGIQDAGFTTHGYEVWGVAIECARANGHTITEIDLSDPTQDDRITPARIAWFSPPCQPFSAAGAGDGEFDERDGLPWTLRLIERFGYDVVFVENVKGLTFARHADYFGAFLTSLRALGYVVEWRVLNCADFGVPQTRERTIVIGRRDGMSIRWPEPTHTPAEGMFTKRWVTMAEAHFVEPSIRVPAEFLEYFRPGQT